MRFFVEFSTEKKQELEGARAQAADIAVNMMMNKDGDFEQMFGKDIDKYLEESEWDIESYEKMSHFSRGSGRNSARGAKLKVMEKAYLQRIETSTQEG